MCNPVQEIQNAFSTVGGWVDRTLSTVSKTFENILKDPLPTIATIGLTAIGVPPMVTSLLRTAMTGGSMENMVIGLATGYIGGEIGAAVGDLAVPELGNIAGYGGAGDLAFQTTATDAILKSVISNASAQGATALLQGKDLDAVLNTALSGAVVGLINTSLRTEFGLDSSKFGDKLISDATKSAVSNIFSGKDPGVAIGEALGQSAFGSIANAAASGLKSTFKDLQDTAEQFDTTQSKADTLREEITNENTRLQTVASELNTESSTLNKTQKEIVEARNLLNLASDAYNGVYASYNPTTQNAFAKRMGMELMTDQDGNGFWVKNIKYGPNEVWYQTEDGLVRGYRQYKVNEYGEIDYKAQVPVSYEDVNLGTEAKAVAEQQSAYLNNTVPKFQTDVEKFNTKLSTFNSDKSGLDTKVNNYTGLVTELFGEKGDGGLNKKLDGLLKARDGYIKDLNESVTSLTEAAGEQIKGSAKTVVDNAVDLLDENFFTSDEVADAFANNAVFEGFEPSAADIATLVGEGKPEELQSRVDNFVDEHSIDLDELREIAQKQGYTLSPEDETNLLEQGDEETLKSMLDSRFDQQAVTEDEALQSLSRFGYKPSRADALAFVGNRSESQLDRDTAAYIDPRMIDIDEAKAVAKAEGIDLSNSDILNLLKQKKIGQVDEATGLEALRSQYDAEFVLPDEVREEFARQGLTDFTQDDVNRFTGRRNESQALTDIGTYADPRVLDVNEVIDLAGSEGYTLTPEQALQYAQQGNEVELLNSLRPKFDEQAITRDEARNYFGDYKPSEREYGLFVGIRNEAEAAQNIKDYADKRSVDYAEARQALISLGYDDPPDELVNQFVGQSEDKTVTSTERGWRGRSYTVTKVIPSDENYESNALQNINDIYDSQFTTKDEVRQMYRDLGLPEPTEDELKSYIGRREEQDVYGLLEDLKEEREAAETARIAKEKADAETARLESAAVDKGFPNYATQQQFNGDLKAYKDSEAIKAGFPDDATRTEYAGNIEKFTADQNEKAALEAGFPDYATLQEYKGDINKYQEYQVEQQRIADESLAKSEGFPDLATKQEYKGDINSYNTKVAADQAEAQRKLNEELAQSNGFPSYSVYSQFDGDIDKYTAAQNELMAKGAEFPDYKTYMEYGGDRDAYEKDLLEKAAVDAGFPDHATQVQYGGSVEAYQEDLKEQGRLEKESLATALGFPDYATYEKFHGDEEEYKKHLEAEKIVQPEVKPTEEIAPEPTKYKQLTQEDAEQQAKDEGFPDAFTKAVFNGDLDAYKKFLSDSSEIEKQQADEYQRYIDESNRLMALEAGFPDYETYKQYDGDYDSYQEKLSADEREREEAQTKLNEELAQQAGFPDYATYSQYDGDFESYQEKLSADQREQEEAQNRLNEELAQTAGFPDYATYEEFDGDYEAYEQSLLSKLDTGTDTGTDLDTGAGLDTGLDDEGGNGDDTLDEDTLKKLIGDDTLEGGDGNDELDDDTLKKLVEDDTLEGGDGNDLIEEEEEEEDTKKVITGVKPTVKLPPLKIPSNKQIQQPTQQQFDINSLLSMLGVMNQQGIATQPKIEAFYANIPGYQPFDVQKALSPNLYEDMTFDDLRKILTAPSSFNLSRALSPTLYSGEE